MTGLFDGLLKGIRRTDWVAPGDLGKKLEAIIRAWSDSAFDRAEYERLLTELDEWAYWIYTAPTGPLLD
ncbi:MAG TPA: hypothetical protein VJU15_02790, partial [Gemmatimonadales bacterium]|nr:hypothetical protein [Gemmatimonadales bacterium]